MTILDEPSDPPRSRVRLALGGTVLLVAIGAALLWLLPGRTSAPPPEVAGAPHTVPTASARAVETPPANSAAPTPAPAARSRKTKAAPPAAAEQPAAPTLTLKVNSDVAGADVFIDRVYIGKAPLETHDVKEGAHTLNASAQGYESQAVPIEVNAGENEVTVRFKVVRLNEAIAVVHKHGIGSCEGKLLADTHGVRYESSNKDHSFDMPFSELRAFEVDYLQKNLRLVRKDGKTFNFTDRNANADSLFVFHKKVEAARARLKDADATPAR